jgi:hypothetical protein
MQFFIFPTVENRRSWSADILARRCGSVNAKRREMSAPVAEGKALSLALDLS